MARTIQMGELVLRCQRRCDLENDNRIANATWKALISEVVADLHSEIATTGDRYFETTETYAADGSVSYDLPDDVLFVVGLDRVFDDGRRYALRELEAQARNAYAQASPGAEAHGYSLVGDRLFLYPPAPSGQTYELLYVPQPDDISTATDVDDIDLVSPAGERFVVWGVSAIAKSSGDMDARLDTQRHEQARQQVIFEAAQRLLNAAPRRYVDESDTDGPRYPGDWR